MGSCRARSVYLTTRLLGRFNQSPRKNVADLGGGWTRDLLVSSRTAHPTEPPRPAPLSLKPLTLANSADDKLEIFFLFFLIKRIVNKIRKQDLTFHANCLIHSMATICMKRQILFSGKNKKPISKCRLLKISPRVLLSVKPRPKSFYIIFVFGNLTFHNRWRI